MHYEVNLQSDFLYGLRAIFVEKLQNFYKRLGVKLAKISMGPRGPIANVKGLYGMFPLVLLP